ncbi:MAG: DUF4349 domain-containing protein [Candidatus Humimicrobiaceae bacterium]
MKKKMLYIVLALISIVFLSFIILTGCASSQSSADEGSAIINENMRDSSSPPTTFAAAQPSEAGSAQAEKEIAPDQSGSNLPVIQPKIIKSASVSIEVAEGTFEESMVKVTKTAESMGGYVSSTESYSDEEGNLSSGRIVIRVPGEKFNSAIDDIKKAGELKSINISGQDVTQEYVDLESRLKNFEAQEKVLLELMEKSTNVMDSIEVQRELSNVQGEMEVIKGRINYLDNLVGFSTIDVYIAEPAVAPPVEAGGFVNAVKRGVEGAVRVLNGLAFVLIAISPILVLAAIVILIVWLSIRSRNKKRAQRKIEAAKITQTENISEKKV